MKIIRTLLFCGVFTAGYAQNDSLQIPKHTIVFGPNIIAPRFVNTISSPFINRGFALKSDFNLYLTYQQRVNDLFFIEIAGNYKYVSGTFRNVDWRENFDEIEVSKMFNDRIYLGLPIAIGLQSVMKKKKEFIKYVQFSIGYSPNYLAKSTYHFKFNNLVYSSNERRQEIAQSLIDHNSVYHQLRLNWNFYKVYSDHLTRRFSFSLFYDMNSINENIFQKNAGFELTFQFGGSI